MSHPEQRFPPTPESVALARAFVHEAIGGVPVDYASVVLMVSELAANAVLHARSPFTVRVRVEPLTLRVEVDDDDTSQLPMLSNPNPLATRGRGMTIIDRCATEWGVESRPGIGKTVWFESPRLAFERG